jgi:abhydrolase domain-containing protein 12
VLISLFPAKQVTPFNLTTPDGEIIYAWHVLPITLYAENRAALLHRPNSGPTGTIVENITATKGFDLLRNDPNARLVINCECSIWVEESRPC